MDAVEEAILNDVVRHENGCWTWHGPTGICSVIRVLATVLGKSLQLNVRLYRLPECTMGSDCVNPSHVDSSEKWTARIRARNRNEQR